MLLLASMRALLGMSWRGVRQRLGFQLLVLGLFCLAMVEGTALSLNCPACSVTTAASVTSANVWSTVCGAASCGDTEKDSCFIGLGKNGNEKLMEGGCVKKEACNLMKELPYQTKTNVNMMRLCCVYTAADDSCEKIFNIWKA